MKTLTAIALTIVLQIIWLHPMHGQHIIEAGVERMEVAGESEHQEVAVPSVTDVRVWVSGGLGLGLHGVPLHLSLNARINSHYLSPFVMHAESEMIFTHAPIYHTDIGLVYGIAGGDAAMYSVGAGLAWVEAIYYTDDEFDDNVTETVGFIIQGHSSLNYYVLGIDVGLHVCLGSRSTAALTIGVNAGKLWGEGTESP